jgi:ribosomal protein S18 acetylase RimI-like enzyme
MYDIRLAKEEELNNLVCLDEAVNSTPWSYIDYYNSYTNDNHHIYLVLDTDNICACCVFGILGVDAEILQLWVSYQYQKIGIGDFLLKKTIELLHQKFLIEKIFLELNIQNKIAKNLYLKNNFKVMGHRLNYYNINNNLTDAITMVHEI